MTNVQYHLLLTSHLRACIQTNRRPFFLKRPFSMYSLYLKDWNADNGQNISTSPWNKFTFKFTTFNTLHQSRWHHGPFNRSSSYHTDLCLFCNQESSAIISAGAFSYHNRELSQIQKTCKSTELCMTSRIPCLSLLYVFSLFLYIFSYVYLKLFIRLIFTEKRKVYLYNEYIENTNPK